MMSLKEHEQDLRGIQIEWIEMHFNKGQSLDTDLTFYSGLPAEKRQRQGPYEVKMHQNLRTGKVPVNLNLAVWYRKEKKIASRQEADWPDFDL